MINLLSKSFKRLIHADYRYRRFVASALLITVAGAIGATLLLPSVFLAYSKKQTAEEQTVIAKQAAAAREGSDVSKIARRTNKQLDILNQEGRTIPDLRVLIDAILNSRPASVALSGFFYESRAEDESGQTEKIVIKGTAQNRDAALLFADNLQAKQVFVSADLPVSSLVPQADIPFTVTAQIRPEGQKPEDE